MHDRPGPDIVAGNRLAIQGDHHYDYDAFGNLIRERRGREHRLITEYRYDCQHRLIGITQPDGKTASYRYDPFGRRISKTVDGKTTEFFWQGDKLIAEHHADRHRSYVYEPDSFRPLALLEGFGPKETKPYHYQLDHLGTPQELTDPSGEIVWSAHYKAYGKISRLDVSKIDNPLRFQGQYFDPESDLHYNRHRYYNPDLSRYLTPDPVKLAGGINAYQYVPNPTGWVDPTGLSCTKGNCPGQRKKGSAQNHEEKSPDTSNPIRSSTYEQASNKALKWLLENDFRAEKPTPGRFGPRKGEPVGMQTDDGKTGYRVEHDNRSGAHINVWSGKKKGPHYLFDGDQELVFQLTKRFAKKMSYLDKELISDLKKHNINFAVLSQAEHEFMVSEINERLPFSGNKIAWSTLDNSIKLGFESTGMAIELLAAEIKKVANNNLIFIGDSACDDAYSISIEHINQALGIFSELPQHTYIVSKPISWIACISFEGHLDFANLYNEFK